MTIIMYKSDQEKTRNPFGHHSELHLPSSNCTKIMSNEEVFYFHYADYNCPDFKALIHLLTLNYPYYTCYKSLPTSTTQYGNLLRTCLQINKTDT